MVECLVCKTDPVSPVSVPWCSCVAVYCSGCLNQWLLVNNECPICRAKPLQSLVLNGNISKRVLMAMSVWAWIAFAIMFAAFLEYMSGSCIPRMEQYRQLWRKHECSLRSADRHPVCGAVVFDTDLILRTCTDSLNAFCCKALGVVVCTLLLSLLSVTPFMNRP